MGGTIRKDFSTKVTHLVAYSTHGEKYRVCIYFSPPVFLLSVHPILIAVCWRDEHYLTNFLTYYILFVTFFLNLLRDAALPRGLFFTLHFLAFGDLTGEPPPNTIKIDNWQIFPYSETKTQWIICLQNKKQQLRNKAWSFWIDLQFSSAVSSFSGYCE